MPLLAFLGLPALAAMLSSFLTAILSFIVSRGAKRVAIIAVAVTAFTGIVVALGTALDALIQPLADASPMPTELVIASSWIIPSNISLYITTLLSYGAIRLVFIYKEKLIEIRKF